MNLNKKDKEVFLVELDKLHHQEEVKYWFLFYFFSQQYYIDKVCSQRCLNTFSKLSVNKLLVDDNCMSNCSSKLLQVYQITADNYETMTKEANKK